MYPDAMLYLKTTLLNKSAYFEQKCMIIYFNLSKVLLQTDIQETLTISIIKITIKLSVISCLCQG